MTHPGAATDPGSRASAAPGGAAPICDLIVLTWNHLEATRTCLESLFRVTTVPCRLIIVDNGSEPAVRAYLGALRPQGAIQDILLLQNETNEGFPRGMNRGLRASTAPYVCLLNNDLTMTAGWLRTMLEIAESVPTVGVLNPASNTLGSRPAAGASLDDHAGQLKARRGEFVEVGMCIGFCMLIKREVIARIGLLSEGIDRLFFEDEDFCMRAQRAGFRCVVVSAAYVFHEEHHSVRDVPEREALFRKNQRWCYERWGRWVRVAWPRFTPPSPGSEELLGWLLRLVALARQRTLVYVLCPLPPGVSGEALFRSVGLVPHADIQWVPLSRPARWNASWRVLARRKKRFDLLISPDPAWGRLMVRLRGLHRARVVPETDEAQLLAQCQRCSRSLS